MKPLAESGIIPTMPNTTNYKVDMMSDFTLRGVADLRKNLIDLSAEVRSNLSSAAEEEAEQIAARARELVPERSGGLHDTIQVVKSELSQGRTSGGQFTSGSAIEVKVIAGDETTPHALTVHEYPSRYDPPSWQGVNVKFRKGGPKFLEIPLKESISGMAERVARRVKI